MLKKSMLLRDIAKILGETNARAKAKNHAFHIHLNRATKVIFDDGVVATQITALALIGDCEYLRVNDEISIIEESSQEEHYKITKIELENQYLRRFFLREI
ncbi:MAG: hypothetical protein ACTTH5_00040 [Wolinella sp.]